MVKEAKIKNTGDNDAWVWMTVAIPSALDVPKDPASSMLHWELAEDKGAWSDIDIRNYLKTNVTIPGDTSGITYNVYTLLYNEVLAAGDETSIALEEAYLDSKLDIDAQGNLIVVANGLTDVDKKWNLNEKGAPIVYVSAYAIQTTGFDTVEDAYDAYQDQWGPNGAEYGKPATTVSTAEDMMENLTEGGDVIAKKDTEMIFEAEEEISLDANGATVTLNGEGAETGWYGYLGFVPPAGEDVSVSNLNVTGSGFVELGHYGQGGGNYTAENIVIKNMEPTLKVTDGANKVAAAFGQYGTATLTDCVMTGVKDAGDGYTYYDAGFPNGTTTYIEGGEYGKIYLWSQAHVTINNAKIGTINSAAITTKNYGMLTIGAGATVDTINLVPAGTYPPALTIEDGATVGKIVYQGTEYTQTEWLNR